MRIIVQHKKVDKHTGEVQAEEVALDSSHFDGHSYVRLTIGDDAGVNLPISDLFTAIEALHRHEVRSDEEEIRLLKRGC